MKKSFNLLVLILLLSLYGNTQETIIIAKESQWKYLDDGSNQGTSWRAIGFDDSSWPVGNGKLGYGDSNNNTTLSYGTDKNNKYITTYFRKTFSLNVSPNNLDFLASIIFDDGAVVYVNGTEAFRCSMPGGTVTYTTLGTGDVGGEAETTYSTYSISSTLFVQGENVIAVEIHQGDVTSSDIGFDLGLVSSEKINIGIDSDIGPLIQNDWSNYLWPYNAYLPEYTGNPNDNGHIGNQCGPTAMARIMHYWKHVKNGKGQLSAIDIYHGVTYSCNFENLNLDYSKMPEVLSHNLTKQDEDEYENVAKLINATSTIGEEIGIGFIGHHEYIAPAMAQYLYFKKGAQVVYRNNYSKEEWIGLFVTELKAGRPILIMGRTADSPAPGVPGKVTGHYFICDGVKTNGEFYFNYSFGGIKGYADIDEMGTYSKHHYAIIGLEPDLYQINETITICEGESYMGKTMSDEFSTTYSSTSGADSIVTTILIVHDLPEKPVITRTVNTLTSSSSSGNKWYLNNTLINGEASRTLEVTEPGDYHVEITNENGCSVTSDKFVVNGIVTTTYETIIICEGESYMGKTESEQFQTVYTSTSETDSIVITTLVVNPIPEKPVITRTVNTLTSSSSSGNKWYLNNTLIAGATSDTLRVTEPGEYFSEITNTNNCSVKSDVFEVTEIITSVKSLAPDWFSVYPNPVKEVLHMEGKSNQKLNVYVYNSLGELQQIKLLNEPAMSIDFSSYPSGIYLIRIINNQIDFTYKIKKE